MLIWRNFCHKNVAVNFRNFHTVDEIFVISTLWCFQIFTWKGLLTVYHSYSWSSKLALLRLCSLYIKCMYIFLSSMASFSSNLPWKLGAILNSLLCVSRYCLVFCKRWLIWFSEITHRNTSGNFTKYLLVGDALLFRWRGDSLLLSMKTSNDLDGFSIVFT